MATITEALKALLANQQNRNTESITGKCLMVVAADGTPVGRLPLTALFASNWWNIQKNVEGYIRVAGSSDPALSYKHYPHKSELNPNGSPFSIFKPCLVGNNLTGSVGQILHVLKKFGATYDSNGNPAWEGENGLIYKIDGSQGEVLIVNTEPYYQIAGHYTIADLDNLELDIFLRSKVAFTFHGVSAELVPKFGWSPDYCVAHSDSGTMRMHSVYNPNWAGSYSSPTGVTGRFVFEDSNGAVSENYQETGTLLGGSGGLHSTDLALYTGEQYAMNINSDTTKTYPFMNQTARGCELLWAGLVSEGGTFDSHKKELFGSGFSANDAANSSTFEASGSDARNGIRIYDKNNTAKYYGLSGDVKFLTGATSTLYAGQLVNSWRNPWHILEAYRAVCYAIKNNIPTLTWFAFEGCKYKWRGVTGFDGPAQGEPTCVVFKMMSSKCGSAAKDPTDNSTSIAGNRIDFVYSTGLWHGITTQVSPSWWTSGLVFTEDENQNYECYMQRYQSELIITPDGEKVTSESWLFENSYTHVAGTIAKGDGYRTNYNNNALMLPLNNASKTGGALHTYVGGYNAFSGGAASSGKKTVRGFRRGGYATHANLSPLFVAAINAPSNTYAGIGFGTCCQIVTA